MPTAKHSHDHRFFDVFLSYAHADAEAVDALADRIEALGYTPFIDQSFDDFRDIASLDGKRIERLRDILSRATCLIYCYRQPRGKVKKPSVWTPWELGFFDGAVSSRIGVYLLDGAPDAFDPDIYFKGSEYLGLYDPVVDAETEDDRLWSLEAFLSAQAVRSRRIDNIRSAFIWFEALREEMLANPVNLQLGVVEWWLAQANRLAGGTEGKGPFDPVLKQIALTRQMSVEAFRNPFFDQWQKAATEFWAGSPRGPGPGGADALNDALQANPFVRMMMEALPGVAAGGGAQQATENVVKPNPFMPVWSPEQIQRAFAEMMNPEQVIKKAAK